MCLSLDGFLGSVALVDTLVAKTRAWEEDHGIPFTYDGVPLLAMLDEYAMLRHDREEEKRRMRVRLTRLLCEGQMGSSMFPHWTQLILT